MTSYKGKGGSFTLRWRAAKRYKKLPLYSTAQRLRLPRDYPKMETWIPIAIPPPSQQLDYQDLECFAGSQEPPSWVWPARFAILLITGRPTVSLLGGTSNCTYLYRTRSKHPRNVTFRPCIFELSFYVFRLVDRAIYTSVFSKGKSISFFAFCLRAALPILYIKMSAFSCSETWVGE
jgi:hypothetical protein